MCLIGLVNSPDAPGQLSSSDLSLCLLTIATVWRVEQKPLPRILVLHVSDDVAEKFGVEHPGVIRHNRCGVGEPLQYYEIWVIGRPEISSYATGLMGVLEDWFSLALSDEERQMAADMAVWAATAALEHDMAMQ
jgi:hypothetical protein